MVRCITALQHVLFFFYFLFFLWVINVYAVLGEGPRE